MAFLSARERALLEAITGLAYSNPFLPERPRFERAALGADYIESADVWSLSVDDPERPRANIWKIAERLEPLAEQLRQRLIGSVPPPEQDLALYQDAILQLLYQRFYAKGGADPLVRAGRPRPVLAGTFYPEFRTAWRHFFEINIRFPSEPEPSHIFACFHQIQRAFN